MKQETGTEVWRFLTALFMAITAASSLSIALFLYAYILPMLEDLKVILNLPAW